MLQLTIIFFQLLGDGLWILLTERVQGAVVGQGFNSSTEFPKEELTKAWESGNAVDILTWGDNQWVRCKHWIQNFSA